MTVTADPTPTIAPRTLVSAHLFDRVVRHVTEHERMDRSLSERIVEQTLAFLKACADNPGTTLTPSPAVDIGWHAFVLHTREYTNFCDRIAGRFIHHEPTGGEGSGSTVPATVDAILAAGMPADRELWKTSADCSQCCAGCHNSP